MFSSACSIFIGAPQAQSTLESQRKINETGAIYKCDLDDKNTNDEHCQPFSFDLLGNRNDEKNDYTYNAENKDYQWLGATMDGGELNTDKMVVSIIPTHITEIFPNNNQKKKHDEMFIPRTLLIWWSRYAHHDWYPTSPVTTSCTAYATGHRTQPPNVIWWCTK